MLLLLAGLVLSGCQGPQSSKTTSAGPATPEPVVVTETVTPGTAPAASAMATDPVDPAAIVGELTYAGVLPDRLITLTDGYGYYEEEGSAGQPFVRLGDQLIATGDLNGDGAEDAAAFLVDNSTGSGDFVYLVAVLSVWSEPRALEAVLIGDRIPVKSLNIAGDQLIVEVIAPGPNDVACCPSQNTRKVFQLEDGLLVERSSEDLGKASLADLNSTSWRLVDLNLDQEPVLPQPAITLRFQDGQINGSGGCNEYSSSVVTSEAELPQSLGVGPIAATQMLCADPVSNQEATFLDRLSKAVAWRYAFGYLSLTYKLENNVYGELLFAPE